jgi:uncharacterized membrane protein YpjA
MRRNFREFAFAFLAWLVPLLASICMFPMKRAFPPLFDSLMGVTLAVNTAVLACLYLRGITSRFLTAGIRIGVLWTLANWGFDGFMFSNGPMKMSFRQYVMEIGTCYLMIPAITVALGSAARAASARIGVDTELNSPTTAPPLP